VFVFYFGHYQERNREMKVVDILQGLSLDKTRGELIRGVASGSVFINGINVDLSDDIDQEFVNEIRMGKTIHLIKENKVLNP
jgi:hypothetical protein